MDEWKNAYNQLNIIDKIRFRWRVRQEEKLEDKRQAVSGFDDRQSIDKLKIAKELKAERENRKNGVKVLAEGKEYKEPENKTGDWIVNDSVNIMLEQDKRIFDKMIEKTPNTMKDFYENFIELQTYLEYPHDNNPNAVNLVAEKFKTMPNEDIEQALKIYQNDKILRDMETTISLEERTIARTEIINNPKLAEALNYLRYHPEENGEKFGITITQKAEYAKMISEQRANENYETEKNEVSQERDL